MEAYTLQLNRTHLLFVPPLDPAHNPNPSSGTVVQVSLRGDDAEGDISNIFSVWQTSVTRTIETLLAGHVNALRELPQYVVVQEAVSGYACTLIGVKKPWKYGHGKRFFLGDVALQPAKHKWIFHVKIEKNDPVSCVVDESPIASSVKSIVYR